MNDYLSSYMVGLAALGHQSSGTEHSYMLEPQAEAYSVSPTNLIFFGATLAPKLAFM